MTQEQFGEFQVILVPGLHNSSPDHWQSLWHARHPAFYRVEQDDWEDPDLPAWTARLDQVRARDPRPALFVAHSFGCLATVASISANPAGVAGALLVAPADPHKFGVADALPHAPLAAPSTVIGSRDDPWMTIDAAALWARRWNSELVDAGAVGHINAASKLGDWPFGWNVLQLLYERVHSPHPAVAA
ncbi:MAG: alpha/beta hydrolase [Massilia sp.]|jgi:predicted alpha/beta hydrolase family esterase|nr:alpha/beta hydrolase [Massilia sp.]